MLEFIVALTIDFRRYEPATNLQLHARVVTPVRATTQTIENYTMDLAILKVGPPAKLLNYQLVMFYCCVCFHGLLPSQNWATYADPAKPACVPSARGIETLKRTRARCRATPANTLPGQVPGRLPAAPTLDRSTLRECTAGRG